ncbi:class I SAM-dependent methyltransferase [Streptomyces sp. NPDC048172]|uniref:class I SAM-dependent methyltransferase n=1 Tax=Streptomyces sp. NPDC048172 TaxID=3365505 RepID=UPI00371FD294
MTVGFEGEVADFYARFRRGYPPEVFDALREAFGLTERDAALDLGCGTGQLAVPLAGLVGTVVGMDPEPDMLRLARETAAARGAGNAVWALGSDADVPALGALLGGRRLAAVTVGQALHWMRHEELFRALPPLLRPGGGLAVVANGAPLWLQDSDWSRALKGVLEEHFRTELKASCGTGPEDRARYAAALEDAGYGDVRETVTEYRASLTFEEVLGGVWSAVPASELPTRAGREALAERLRAALPGREEFTEHVSVSLLLAHAPREG